MGGFCRFLLRLGYLGRLAAASIVAGIAFLIPLSTQAQCPADAGSIKSDSFGPQGPSPQEQTPQFFDEPQFNVAGVSDTTNLGGHGSDAIVRTKESLARDAVALSKASPQSASVLTPDEESLREKTKLDPQNPEANFRLGKLLLDSGKPAESLSYFEQASHLNPGDYENSYQLTRAYAGTGQYERAQSTARMLVDALGKTRERASKQQWAELHHLLADVEENLSHSLDAVREYQLAAELNPTEVNLFDLGAELLMHHAPEPASEVFSNGSRLFPHSTRMLVGLGVASYVRGSYDQAVHFLCQASAVNPKDPSPYLFLGKMQSADTTGSKNFEDMLGRFVRLQPENAWANYYYAVSLWRQRQSPDDSAAFAQSESFLQKAIHLDPKLGVVYLQLGILYSDRRELSQAISAYQKAIETDSQMEEAHYRLAQAYRATGEKLRAQQEIDLYRQISQKKEGELERQRHEIKQFVITMRNPIPASPPQ